MNFFKVGKVCIDDMADFIPYDVCVKFRFSDFKKRPFEYGTYTWKEFLEKYEGCYFYATQINRQTEVMNVGVAEYYL